MHQKIFRENIRLKGREGEYTLKREIARAAQGIIFEAINGERKVVVKVPNTETDGEVRENIEKLITVESKILKRLAETKRDERRGIVEILDFGGHTNDSVPFLVLEHLGEIQLREVNEKEGSLKPKTALRITRTLLDTVVFLAENGVFHRDIKPDNLMYVPKRGAVLIDFGIAQSEREEEKPKINQIQEMVFGTPGYMSLERWRGGDADIKSEIFAVSVTALILMTNTDELGKYQIDGKYFDNREGMYQRKLGKLEPRVRELIEKGIAKTAENRIDLEKFREEIDRIQNPPKPKEERLHSEQDNIAYALKMMVAAGLGALAAQISELL